MKREAQNSSFFNGIWKTFLKLLNKIMNKRGNANGGGYLQIANQAKSFNEKREIIIQQFMGSAGYSPNIENPQTFNEKIQWLKLYYRDAVMTQCADKYRVRDYVKVNIGEQYLIKLLGIYDDVNQIDFDKLPDQFVLKVNHGCGLNIICENKNELDFEGTKKN